MPTTAGYSGTPLPKKLGLKDGQVVAFIGLPNTQNDLLSSRAFMNVSEPALAADLTTGENDYVHLFSDDARIVRDGMNDLCRAIKPDGMIWVSWPKKASKVPTDMSEDVIRNKALEGTLVDVKVCAVDEIWSGLKLVVRKELRAQHNQTAEKG